MKKLLFVLIGLIGVLIFMILYTQKKEYVLKLTSNAWLDNEEIPQKYTGEGADASPELSWSGAPAETKSFVLIVDDPDAQSVAGKIWVHWVLFNMPADLTALPEAADAKQVGAVQGMTDFNRVGYGGPMPPTGHGVHHYYFKLYALDTMLDLKKGATKAEVEAAIRGHILAQTQLIGTYERN